MKLSSEQSKTFLRLQRKHNVSVAFILRNMPAILKFVQYAITPHIVLKRKLIRRHNRIFLRHNYLRKLIFDPSQLKKRRIAKRRHSQWSKRMVLYLRRFMVKCSEDELFTGVKLPEGEVSKQLKEQLELLKTGKRTVPLLEDINNVLQRESLRSSIFDCTDETSASDNGESEEFSTITEEADFDGLNKQPEGSLISVIGKGEHVSDSFNGGGDHNETTRAKRLSNSSDRHNGNFLDMLISKVKSSADDITDPGSFSEKSNATIIVENDGPDNSNSSSDFCGFEDNERITGTFPGMLSTPLVQKRGSNSAFESETLNAYMRENSLESSATVDLPQRRPENGLVIANSIPPKLDMPAMPEGLQGLRTVAERRAFLQRTRNVKYSLMNNVAIIFHELQKKIKGHRINKQAIEALQASSSVPLTRQGWKAATWLLTDVGNYHFQTISVDENKFRLYGCRGNSQKKFKRPHSSRCVEAKSVCTEDCMDRITFRALRPIRTIERRSKLSDISIKTLYKACPLSQKIVQSTKNDEQVFGSLGIVRMPQVELEVFPRLHKPLNDVAKRYLELILPYNGISREWAEFSVSTLLERHKVGTSSNVQQSFTFPLPYANDRDHVLVRRIYKRCEAFEGQFDNSNFSFRNEIDQKRSVGGSPDLLAEECADVLTDMFNSIAISCSENSFIKDDPDNIYKYGNGGDDLVLEKSAKKAVELHPHNTGHHNKKQSRMLMELKRLNATIIDAAASKIEEDGSPCDRECCKFGCVCGSLNEGTTIRQHCGKQRCMLDCNCKFPSIMRLETDGRTITTEDAFMLRRQATAKLARMEKDFTSTIVLTGSETLLINESQYDKKRRCTKIPKRYGEFVDSDENEITEMKVGKRIDTAATSNTPLEPIMVNDKIFQHLRHCRVSVKRLRDIKDVAPWCMTHMLYNCYCKGQVTVGNPIVLEKQEYQCEATTYDEVSGTKTRTLYSFDREESKTNKEPFSSYENNSGESDISESCITTKQCVPNLPKREGRGRISDHEVVKLYMNAKANHCRRVVSIPRKAYMRRAKKRIPRTQLYIAENETDETTWNLNEHVLRSVYYHKNSPNVNNNTPITMGETTKGEETKQFDNERKKKRKHSSSNTTVKEIINLPEQCKIIDIPLPEKKRRMNSPVIEEGSSLLRVNRYKDKHLPASGQNSLPLPNEQITVPKISKIYSLSSEVPMDSSTVPTALAADIPHQSTEISNTTEDVSTECFKNIFQVVIKNMNNLVSKKMHDIDMALRRESRAIPAPNADILCIIRWNNFLNAFTNGFVFLWEVRTANKTFIAGTITNVMPLVANALSVVNVRALSRDGAPLLVTMLTDQVRNTITDNLAVVMQGQALYWFVNGFLFPDRTRICAKPTPESHPLLTKKINVLCRLLINQQINEQKKRQEAANQMITAVNTLQPIHQSVLQQQPANSPLHTIANNPLNPPKLKVLPMQRNMSDDTSMTLENLITKAYGSLRTNIAFRRVHRCEIGEFYQPASMNTDHQWLVIDLSNDFSHIFIPELKDLLTLDRIQKVMTYSCTKNRIVKMQFSPKSLFNAYVTPMSSRKLYFGPFRNTNHAPKLILLQSVDGTMLLREAYEVKHNITRTDKTTAVWLVQRGGELFIDLEPETPLMLQPVVGIEEQATILIDDDDCVTSNNVPGVHPIRTVPERLIEVRNIPIITNAETECAKKPDEDDDDCMIIETEDHSLPVPVVVEPPERLLYTISYAGENSSLVVIQNTTVVDAIRSQDPIRSDFTILTSQCDRSLINNSESEPSQSTSSQQQLPEALEQLPSVVNIKPQETDVFKNLTSNYVNTCSDAIKSTALQQLNRVVNIKPQDPETIKIPAANHMNKCTDAIQSRDLPIDIVISALKTNGTNISGTNLSSSTKPSETVLQPSPITPSANISNLSGPFNSPHKEPENACNERVTPVSDTNLSTNEMKWNKNVTIKKLPLEGEQSPLNSLVTTSKVRNNFPGLIRLPLTVKSIPTGRIMIQNQTGKKVCLTVPSNAQMPLVKPVIIRAPLSKPRFQMPQALRPAIQQPNASASHILPLPQQIRQSPPPPSKPFQKPPNTSTAHISPQSIRRSPTPTNPATYVKKMAMPNIIRPVLRPTVPPRGGIIIRTPTAINTFVRNQQQQQLVRSPTSNMTGVNSPRMSLNTTTGILQSANVVKIATEGSNLSRAPNTVQHMESSRVVPKSTENPLRANMQKSINKITQLTRTCGSPQSDPLLISEKSSEIVNSLQPKLPDAVKTVQITPLLPGTSCDAARIGAKRNSAGMRLNCTTVRSPQLSKQIPLASTNSEINNATVVTTVDNSSNKTTLLCKGIPVDVPRLKKFAVISSNTTIITPPTTELCETTTVGKKEETASSASIVETPLNSLQTRKTIASAYLKSSAASSSNTKSLIKGIPSSTTGKSATLGVQQPGAQQTDTEYGYFQANLDGVPNFVAKRIQEEFLIKVPNFNGILKLKGLPAVYNYLHKFTEQKCGKTYDELVKLKFTFKAQDRTKQNNINKSNASAIKQTQNVAQKLLQGNRAPSTRDIPTATPNALGTPNLKSTTVASVNKNDAEDP